MKFISYAIEISRVGIFDFVAYLDFCNEKCLVEFSKWSMHVHGKYITSLLGQVTDTAMWNAIYEHSQNKKCMRVEWNRIPGYIGAFCECEIAWGKIVSWFDLFSIQILCIIEMDISFDVLFLFRFLSDHRIPTCSYTV